MDPSNPFDTAAPAPPGPPPPYESIISSADEPASTTASAQEGTFDITVCDPVKQGEGVSAYVSYKVRSHVSGLEQYAARPRSEVIRRYRDFTALAAWLAEAYRGVIIPPLPDKSAVQKFQMSAAFIEERRRALQVFLVRVTAHPVLRTSPELQRFLTATEDEWVTELARLAGGGGGVKGRLEGAVGWLRGLGSATSALVGGKSSDAGEDPEYLKVRDYLASLESHLGEASRQASRLLIKEQELADATAEFGQAIERLGRLEEGNVQEAFVQLSSKAQQLATAARGRHDATAAGFEAPLREAVRAVRSAQAVCTDRAAALGALHAAQADLDAKKVRWAKMRGTPGSAGDKLAEAEKDVREAELRVRSTRIGYEEIVSRMTEELNRFQKERAVDMNRLLRDFALAQAGLAADGAKAWSGLLSELQAITG